MFSSANEILTNGLGYAGELFSDFTPYLLIIVGVAMGMLIIETIFKINDKDEK